MVLVFLANGFEEIEALATVDVLRRAELDVVTVGVGGKLIRGSHGIIVAADAEDQEVSTENLEAVVLPGGMPGTLNLEKSPVVQRVVEYAAANRILLCAICAAPSILGHKGLLENKKAVCFPGYEQELIGARIQDAPVVTDGSVITGRGAGAAIPFSLAIVSKLVSEEVARKLEASMQCR